MTEWRRLGLPFKDEAIVVAVSGGADSMSLLLAIDDLRQREKIDLRIVAAHFDHRLRHDSRTDLEFVSAFASERKIELAHAEWRERSAGNLEQNARRARYKFLLETAERLGAGHVLTAHTMNDQAETVLMNLIRGSGPGGLAGIEAVSLLRPIEDREAGPEGEPFLPFPSADVLLVRPMLSWAMRKDTEGFCRQNSVDFCLDPMNEDINFRRVWIRKVLIPMLAEINPKIVETLCQTAELQRRAFAPAREVGVKGSVNVAIKDDNGGGPLSVARLREAGPDAANDLVREWLRQNRGGLRGIGAKHIDAIVKLATTRKSGRVAELPGSTVTKTGGKLYWRQRKAEKG